MAVATKERTAAERIAGVAEMLAAARGRSATSTEIAVATPAPVMAPGLVTFTPDQISLLKRTICQPKEREATRDELALFVGQCKRTGLDPFSKQIYAIFRKKHGREEMTVQTGIDGFRLIAERTGCYLGVASTLWCGSDADWQETWLTEDLPAAAKVTVRKLLGGHVAETTAVAHWAEYKADGPMWKPRAQGGMPANQLAKCAEALATRRAFPNDLSGIYTADEMAQADAQPLAIAAPAAAEPADAEVVAEATEAQDDRISPEELATLKQALDAAEIDEQTELMLLGLVGVETLDELTPATLAELQQAIAEHITGGAS